MKGQWTGAYQSTHRGQLVVDVDELADCYTIAASAFPSEPGLPGTYTHFKSPDKSSAFGCLIETVPLDPRTFDFARWETIQTQLPNLIFARHLHINVETRGSDLRVNWTDGDDFSGEALLSPSRAKDNSSLQAEEVSWEEFQSFVRNEDPDKYVFRGHSDNTWKLRTTFHRSGRANLTRYFYEDLPELRFRLSSLLPMIYDLDNPLHLAAMLGLAQHHGYPTPLLDWTRSPFIAAFFAYNSISNSEAAQADPTERVRILLLNQRNWRELPQFSRISPNPPHVSLLNPLAFGNPRIAPQQGITTATNIDDVEAHLIQSSNRIGREFLRAFDLPKRDRAEVIKDLLFMGIGAGALFPGLEGVCLELKERRFSQSF